MLVDNKILYHALLWEGCRNQGVNLVLKKIFETTLRLNIALHPEWVLSELNPAGHPSRDWSHADVKLAPKFSAHVESAAGPHTIDLMALDYNSQCPRHYTPYPTPLSKGVNFFAHNPSYDNRGGEENCYCFPPIFLIGPAIQHLLSSKAKATVIIPDLIPRQYWWPMLHRCANKRYLLAKKGKHEVLLWPSKCHGFHQPRLW